jgi:hypothetical protein
MLGVPLGLRLAGELHHLERARDSQEIVRVEASRRRRVDDRETRVQRTPALRLCDGAVLFAQGFVARPRLGKAPEERLHPQEGAAAHDWPLATRADVRDGGLSPANQRNLVRVEMSTAVWRARSRSAALGLPEPMSKRR